MKRIMIIVIAAALMTLPATAQTASSQVESAAKSKAAANEGQGGACRL